MFHAHKEQDQATGHHGKAQQLPHGEGLEHKTEMLVRFAVKFDKEAHAAVSHEVNGNGSAGRFKPFAAQP